MYNWSVDIEKLKEDKEKYTIWRLEQLINYGLNGEKLNKELLLKYWPKLHLDPRRKKFLEFILWEKRP